MERTHKTWGQKWSIFQNDTCEVSVLYLQPRQRCSYHNHKTKYNLFFVIEGELQIKHEWGIAHLDQGQIFTTRPGEFHEFRTCNVPAKVIEVMFVTYDSEDINRERLGGPIDE